MIHHVHAYSTKPLNTNQSTGASSHAARGRRTKSSPLRAPPITRRSDAFGLAPFYSVVNSAAGTSAEGRSIFPPDAVFRAGPSGMPARSREFNWMNEIQVAVARERSGRNEAGGNVPLVRGAVPRREARRTRCLGKGWDRNPFERDGITSGELSRPRDWFLTRDFF